MKKLNLILIFVLSLISISGYAVTAISSDELTFSLSRVKGISYQEGDRFHIIVDHISTSDKKLFPGIGRMLLHTSGEESDFKIKGTIVITPTLRRRFIYISLKEMNRGKVMDVIYASKFGQTLSVLKLQLRNRNVKISNKRGGYLRIKILKNGIFGSYHNYDFLLNKLNGEWVSKVKIRGRYIFFRSMFLEASSIGIRRVQFQ